MHATQATFDYRILMSGPQDHKTLKCSHSQTHTKTPIPIYGGMALTFCKHTSVRSCPRSGRRSLELSAAHSGHRIIDVQCRSHTQN